MGNVCRKVASSISNGFKKVFRGIYNGVKKIGKAIFTGIKKVVTKVGKLIYQGFVLVGYYICKIVKYIWKNLKKIIDGICWIIDKAVVIINGIKQIIDIKKYIDYDMGSNHQAGVTAAGVL